jgi:hypothetical protein
MENVVFWDIKSQFVPHRRHITSPLQSPAGYFYVRFEVFTVVTMKNAVFWNVTSSGSCVSEECITSIIRMERISVLGKLAVISN